MRSERGSETPKDEGSIPSLPTTKNKKRKKEEIKNALNFPRQRKVVGVIDLRVSRVRIPS